MDFSTGTFLQITVDANGDGQITAADPPLLPRQSVVPSIYANVSGEAWKMTVLDAQGKPTTTSAGWSALFDTGNPATGKIDGTKLATGTVGKDQLGVDAVETPEIKNGSVTLAKLNTDALDALGGTDSITSLKIKDGTITSADIAPGGLTSDRLAADYDSGWFDVTILKSYSKTLGFNDLPRFVTAYYKLPNGEIFLWGTESYADDHSLTGIALDFDGLGKLYVRSYGRSVLSVGSLRNRLDTGFESIPEAVSCQFRVMAWR